MIRGVAEAIGWFITICALANLADLIEFRLYLSAPAHTQCSKKPPVKPKTNVLTAEHPDIQQLKRDARRLSKTQPYTLSQALELLARQQGYSTYAAMREILKEAA